MIPLKPEKNQNTTQWVYHLLPDWYLFSFKTLCNATCENKIHIICKEAFEKKKFSFTKPYEIYLLRSYILFMHVIWPKNYIKT